jgi:hypothetical protein
VSLSIEAAALNDPDLRAVSDTVDWRLLPANRVAFALLDRPGADEFDSEARAYIRDGFNTFGDSAIIENTHNVLRRMTSAQSNEVSSECRRQYHCIVSTVLQERGIDTVDIAHECEEPLQLSEDWSHIIVADRDWLSKTPERSLTGVWAWCWLRRLHIRQLTDARPSHGCLSTCMGVGAVVRHRVAQQVGLSLGNVVYAACILPMVRVAQEPNMFRLDVQAEGPVFVFVYNLTDWEAWDTTVLPP